MENEAIFHNGIGSLASDTEVLTPTGWLNIAKVTGDTLVAQYLVQDKIGYITFVHPVKLTKGMVDKAYSLSTNKRHVDQLVNSLHGIIYVSDLDKLVVKPVSQSALHHSKIINAGLLYNDSDRELSLEEQLRIAIQADGTIARQSARSDGIRFKLKKDRKLDRIKTLLDNLGISYNTFPSNTDGCTFYTFLTTPGYYEKDFDWIDLTDKGHMWCTQFVKEVGQWDSTNYGKNKIQYFNNRKIAVDRVQAVAISAGFRTCLSARNRVGTNWNTQYTLSITDKRGTLSEVIDKKIVDYNVIMYRVVVPTRMIVIRRNDAVSITACGDEFSAKEITSLDLDLSPVII